MLSVFACAPVSARLSPALCRSRIQGGDEGGSVSPVGSAPSIQGQRQVRTQASGGTGPSAPPGKGISTNSGPWSRAPFLTV